MNKSESKYFNTAVRFNKALLALLEKKPFAYITISEICAEAGVNRSTFYLHYENLSDLLKETSTYVLDGFTSYFPINYDSLSARFADCELQELNFITEEYLHPYLSYIKENRRIFEAVLSQPAIFETNAVYQRLFDHVFDPILERFHYPHKDRRYVMMFYLNGITAIVKEWLQDGCSKSIEEIGEVIRYCIFGIEK
ncbi:MAG: TetR/AcrR family transcriptional regulator [Oscillospiraceae bacterium]|nr:TetR/AcrR family transcriptional regulator [Oscillospiraceae bacterium]